MLSKGDEVYRVLKEGDEAFQIYFFCGIIIEGNAVKGYSLRKKAFTNLGTKVKRVELLKVNTWVLIIVKETKNV